MDIEDAHRIIADFLAYTPGRFYGAGADVSLGVGKIYQGICYPIFNREDGVFDTVEGAVLVLTHECDIDQTNRRAYNDYLLVCPIIPFEAFVSDYSAQFGDDNLRGFLTELAKRNVSRLVYIPWGLASLPYGGVLYLNQISSTHISAFQRNTACAIGVTTGYGLHEIDHSLTNHLLRPKAEHLPLERT